MVLSGIEDNHDGGQTDEYNDEDDDHPFQHYLIFTAQTEAIFTKAWSWENFVSSCFECRVPGDLVKGRTDRTGADIKG